MRHVVGYEGEPPRRPIYGEDGPSEARGDQEVRDGYALFGGDLVRGVALSPADHQRAYVRRRRQRA